MKAIRLHARGGPEQLIYEGAPQPHMRHGDALVRVYACAITHTELTWSETYTTREGKDRLPTIPGHEFSGVVEAVASGVIEVRAGDSVYGLADFSRDGAAADYVAIRAADLASKPSNLNHIQAAAVPLAALTAWQALFDHAGLSAGQRVLIHGATGGVGSFAVQLAHQRGIHVVGTAKTDNLDLLRQLGANEAIDYTAARFEDSVRDVDAVFDTVGGETLERSFAVLRRGGVLVSVAETPSADRAAQRGVRAEYFIVEPNRGELMEISRLIQAGDLRPLIEAVFPLEQAREAFEHGSHGHSRGKIVLQVEAEPATEEQRQPEKARRVA
ncbi:MAG TPA: NADP-dependent oxidoreductase [Terriglobales bacterium]|nr:NADP-dependent oxidoreductase [Terriglobales bacterium]